MHTAGIPPVDPADSSAPERVCYLWLARPLDIDRALGGPVQILIQVSSGGAASFQRSRKSPPCVRRSRAWRDQREPSRILNKRNSLHYRLLGNSQLRVSEAALGAMTFGEDLGWGAAKDEARKVCDAFRDAGGNFIDTANVYTNGTITAFLGEFMQGHRQSVATKYSNSAAGTDPNAVGRMNSATMKDFLPEQPRADRVAAAVRTVSDQTGRSMAQVSRAWLRCRPVPVIPIAGARKLAQLQDNLASFDLELSADQWKTLDEASRVEMGFPHDLYDKELVRGLAYGGLRDRVLA